jgi:hypothetical protein
MRLLRPSPDIALTAANQVRQTVVLRRGNVINGAKGKVCAQRKKRSERLCFNRRNACLKPCKRPTRLPCHAASYEYAIIMKLSMRGTMREVQGDGQPHTVTLQWHTHKKNGKIQPKCCGKFCTQHTGGGLGRRRTDSSSIAARVTHGLITHTTTHAAASSMTQVNSSQIVAGVQLAFPLETVQKL